MKQLITTIIVITAFSLLAQAQNDPKYVQGQQYYIGAHNIDQVWNTTKGNSNTRIAIHSAMGFSVNHEDMSGTRYLTPMTTDAYDPAEGFAQEVAGVIGARTNNSTGMAGINWYSKLKSYNFIKYEESGDDPDYVFDADNTDYTVDIQRMNNMVDQAHNDNMDVQVFTFGVPTSSQSVNADFAGTNPSLSDYRALTSGPSFSTPSEAFWDAFQSRLSTIASTIWNDITGNNYIPPSSYQTFRGKLYDAAVQDNSLLNAAVGDKKDGDEPLPTLVPFAFDDYVIGVGGAEVPGGQTPIYWDGGGASSFMDIVAAAEDITTLSGDSYTSYNNSFSSTHGASAIVGGVVSLLKTQNTSLSYDDIEHILENTAVDIEGADKDDETGHGFLDAKAALDYINTNDFVRKRVQKSEMQTISYSVESPEYLMDSDYDVYKPDSWANTTYSIDGKLGTFTGRVEFDYVFSSPPDVWLRNSSSGTEVNLVPYQINYLKQYYDAYGSKSIQVISVDKYGFYFEMKYWNAEFTDASGPVGTVQIPDMDNIHIDYTAVGDETIYQRPLTPTGLTLTAGGFNGNNPELNWSTVNGIDSYKIYRGTIQAAPGMAYCSMVSEYSFIGSTTSTSYTDVSVFIDPNEDILVCYYVTSVKAVAESYPSNEVGTQGMAPLKVVPGKKTSMPTFYSLDQNYPNPFNPSTQLKYALPESSDVTIKVYNIMGQEVATLVNENLSAGFHEVIFDAGGLSSGVYIARMRATGSSGQVYTKELKMQLIK